MVSCCFNHSKRFNPIAIHPGIFATPGHIGRLEKTTTSPSSADASGAPKMGHEGPQTHPKSLIVSTMAAA
jgi:hypothetical protein